MASDAFATLDDLKNRLDWELDPYEERIATAALDDASDLARHYGRDWDVALAPRLVRTLVLKACKRYMINPDGYTQSRAGDETVMWNDRAGENAGTVYFTRDEQELLRGLAGTKPTIQTTQVVAWNSQPRRKTRPEGADIWDVTVYEAIRADGDGLVPEGHPDGFPMFDDSESPW